jgi:hypothetical protein
MEMPEIAVAPVQRSRWGPLGWNVQVPTYARFPVWSPDGSALAFVVEKSSQGNGAWVLDCRTMMLTPIRTGSPPGSTRPIWDGNAQVLTGIFRNHRRYTLAEGMWRQTGEIEIPGVTLWAERATASGYVGLLIPAKRGPLALVRLSADLFELALIPLSAELFSVEYPAWWVPDRSLILRARQAAREALYLIDTDSGQVEEAVDARPEGIPRLHCFGSATGGDWPVACSTTYPQQDPVITIASWNWKPAIQEIWIREFKTTQMYRVAEVTVSPIESPPALSPNADRLALIDDGELHIIPVPAAEQR